MTKKEDKKVTKEKTIHDLEMHEVIEIETNVGSKIEIMKVTGGWIYILDFPGWRQCKTVFVPQSYDIHGKSLTLGIKE